MPRKKIKVNRRPFVRGGVWYKNVTIPSGYYKVKKEEKKLTRYRQGGGGLMVGRYTGVPERYHDNTRYVRIVKPYDVDNDEIPDLTPGMIVSRIKSGKHAPDPLRVNVKMSSKADKSRSYNKYIYKKAKRR